LSGTHEEQGLVGEAGVLGAKALGVVLLFYVDEFLGSSDGADGRVVVAAFFEDDQAAESFIEDEVQREVAVSHRHDGIEGVGIAGADQVAEFLADDFDFLAFVEFGGTILHFFGDDVADTAKLLVAVGVGFATFEDHFAAFEHGAFGNQDRGVVAGIFVAVGDQALGEIVDVEFVFGDDAAVRGSGHSGKHGGEASVAAENFEDQETFVRAGRGAQIVGELNGAGDAGAETDTVIGAGDVVVHGLGDGDDFETFLVQPHAVAEGVIAADGNHVVDAEPFEIFQHFRSEIVSLSMILALEVFGDVGFAGAARIGARGMEKSAAGASGAIDDILGEYLEILGVVVGLVAHHLDQAAPAMAKTDDLVAFAERAKGDAADGGIEAGDVAASGENADNALFAVQVSHGCAFAVDSN